MRVLRIYASEAEHEIEEMPDTGAIDFGLSEMERAAAASKEVLSPELPFIFSTGPLSTTGLPGTHRLTFVFRSPLTGSFFVSSMGGAGFTVKACGIDAVVVTGKAQDPLVVTVGKNGVEIKAVEPREAYYGIKEKGILWLSKFATTGNYRLIGIGAAAFKTPFATTKSIEVAGGKLKEGTEDFSGRAGSGSALFQAHGVLGFIFEPFSSSFHTRSKEALEVMRRVFGPGYMKKIMEAGSKYLNKGTFGGNYEKLSPITPCRNFRNIYGSSCEAEMLSAKWLGAFRKAVLDVKAMVTCGEPCPLRCKKVYNGIKIDYEPLNSFGPYIGLFDFKAAAEVAAYNDFLGFDAIELGHIIGWVLEAKEKKLLPEEVPARFPFSEQELKNFAITMLRKLAFSEHEFFAILRQGRRRAAELFEELYGSPLKDLAVYVPFGTEGYVAPTMYWALGNFVPVPLQGRYWTYYKPGVWLEPEELAEKCYERALAEAAYDDLGLCRFHRKWFEEVKEPLQEALNLTSEPLKLLQRIIRLNERAAAVPKPAETQRVFDIFARAALNFGAPEEWKRLADTAEELYRTYVERFLRRYNALVFG